MSSRIEEKLKTYLGANAPDENEFENSRIETMLDTIISMKSENGPSDIETDPTLSISGKAADSKATGDAINSAKNELNEDIDDLKAIIDDIEPGLSVKAKEALLACFSHVAWTDGNGQNYYEALENALIGEVLKITLMNRNAIGRRVYYFGPNNTEYHYGAYDIPNNTARARISDPLENKNYVFLSVNPDKYTLALFALYDGIPKHVYNYTNESVLYEEDNVYRMSDDTTVPSWAVKGISVAPYVWLSFKKMDNTDFTTDEIDNAEGTIFVYGKSENVIKHTGPTTSSGSVGAWVDSNNIIGITNPSKLALVAGYTPTANSYNYSGAPNKTTGVLARATSLSQAIVGDLDGKSISLSKYTLSNGTTISFALWYGYLTSGSYDGTSFVDNTTNDFLHGKWFSETAVLPINPNKIGTRVLLMAFKGVNINREFTQAELREIPTLIRIS